ncbi:phage major tail protein, TP901-1 family [[Clostridium] scindens]|uniref:phage major tail protein, TP901-1 family n=1 Tax=Clostridium scindens (strain JCM 10418 / VPI 12708) TaxID=29347 RepID=UPI002097120C|nr:phage major tail protein, TP901-1 family [[Clostridium] scindens]MCO7172558.1 phage major tail protein, TP901-1 family [[Clostridium] scindens]
MEKPILGKDKILKFRRLADASKQGAARLALQIEHTINYEANTDSQMTKDGPVNYSGGLTTTIEMTAVSTRDEVNQMLRQAVLKQEVLEVWEIDLGAEPVDGKYPAKYGQGLLSEWEDPANVEEAAQFTTTFNVDGELQDGLVSVTDEEIKEVQYVFRDTEAVAAPAPAQGQ